MQNRFLTMLALSLTLAACAEDGKDGADGTNGTDGATGTDGTDGATGADGTSGDDGADGLCADATQVEITGLTDLPTDTIDAYYATDAVTVETNAPGELTYTVAGYGLDYEWDGDTFTVTPTTDSPSSQVIVATDGCSTATYQFDVAAEVGVAWVNFVHLYDGAPSADLTLTGDDLEDAVIGGLGLATQTGYLEVTAMPWSFDLWADEAVVATLDTLEPRGEGVYTVVIYSDAGAVATMVIDDDISEVVTEDAARVRATHVADTLGQIDIWDTVAGTALFSDIDFGTSSADTDVPTGEYTVGIDADDDGTSDYGFETVDLTGLEGAPINVFAYMHSGTPFLFVSAPWYGVYERILPDPLPAASTTSTGSSTPAMDITDYDYTVGLVSDYDAIELADACTVLDVTVNVDISHTWKGDLNVNLWSPDGTMVALHDRTGGSANDIVGSYVSDGTGTLTSADDLNMFLFADGTGDWTLELIDNAGGDTGTLNSWDITLGCL
jgi:subtilisin-like proprotein convertase family protein